MIYLFIDTSISIPTIALIRDNDILFEFHEKINSDMSSKILPIIDEAFEQNNLSIKSVDKIFVVTGPGSFTGVRIGVTIAKTIAWSLNIPVIPISSLEFIATSQTDFDYIVPMIDARRGNVFGGIYDSKLNKIKEDGLYSLNNLLFETKNNNVDFLSYDDIASSRVPVPNVIKIIKKHIHDIGVVPHKLKPNYLKLTEAEENRLKND